jgi:hypothetical protein
MLRPGALALAVTATVLGGCGNDHKPVPSACTSGANAIVAALGKAPRPVRLKDGTSLSACVERAFTDAQVQEAGMVLTRATDLVAVGAKRSDDQALQLGYLVAAVRRGAAHTQGIHAELVRRIEAAADAEGLPMVRRGAFTRGLAAGARSG